MNLSINHSNKNSLEENEINILTNQNNYTYDNDILTDPSLNNIKKDLELDNIISKQSSKRKSKTIKKITDKQSKEDEELEEESEYEVEKEIKKKKKHLKEINSLMNYLNSNDENADKNNQLKINYSNFLSEEDVNKLMTYSKQLKKIYELDDKEKTEDIIQIEKEIKQRYNGILTKYLINRKYKDLLKEKKYSNEKRLKFLLEKKK